MEMTGASSKGRGREERQPLGQSSISNEPNAATSGGDEEVGLTTGMVAPSTVPWWSPLGKLSKALAIGLAVGLVLGIILSVTVISPPGGGGGGPASTPPAAAQGDANVAGGNGAARGGEDEDVNGVGGNGERTGEGEDEQGGPFHHKDPRSPPHAGFGDADQDEPTDFPNNDGALPDNDGFANGNGGGTVAEEEQEVSMSSSAPLKFLVVGDWGRQGNFNQTIVADAMGVIGDRLQPKFVVSTGDNFYESGLSSTDDPLFTDSFTNIYTARSLQTLWYADTCTSTMDIFFLDTSPFVEEYWSSGALNFSGMPPRDELVRQQLMELDASLRKSTSTWKLVVGHHPIRSVGEHGDTAELVSRVLPILEPGSSEGAPAAVDIEVTFVTSGAGSKAYRPQRPGNTLEGVHFDYNGQGFISVAATALWLHVDFYDVYGTIMHDLHLDK
eukprot:jgi/Mesen1/5877/ME000299S05001